MKSSAPYKSLLFCVFAVSAFPARAADSCVKTTRQEVIYYNNAAHDTSIGWFSTCPGSRGKHRRTSPWKEVDVHQVSVCGENGKLPCRIDPARCLAIPDPNLPLPLDTEQEPQPKPKPKP
jgi:hypothetical protein